MTSLTRFKEAQEGQLGFAAALAEMQAGRKTSHWIWYIFPQLDGLGRSPMARRFGLRDTVEAQEYLADPALRGRLLAVTREAERHLASGTPVEWLMGSEIDAQKLVSSMTLFHRAVPASAEPEAQEIARLAGNILMLAGAQGYPACALTLERCAAG